MTNCFTSSGLFGNLLSDAPIAELFAAGNVLKHAVSFETAWTETLISLAAVTPQDGQSTLVALRAYAPDLAEIGQASARDGVPVPEIVAQMRAGLPDVAAKAIHSGTTSQDVMDTVLVLILLEALDELGGRLQRVVDALNGRIRQADGTMMGRTRMQAALPIPVAARLCSWATPLDDHLARLDGLRAQIGQVQLGGPVGLRDAPEGQGDLAARQVAQRLGLSIGPVWHSNRTPVLDVGHWLMLVSGSLGKMGQDVTLMAQQGVDEIRLAGGGGSSAMPHKANPVLAETLVALARFVGTQQGGLTQVMVHEQERSGVLWTLEWMLLPPMVEATAAGLRHAEVLLGKIERIGPAGGI